MEQAPRRGAPALDRDAMRDDFTQLERDLLSWIGAHGPVTGLTAQIGKATFRRREYTGAGFYVDFDVPGDLPRLETCSGPIEGPSIISPELEAGAGTLLWHEEGMASCLEVFSYGDTFPETLHEYELQLPTIARASDGRGRSE